MRVIVCVLTQRVDHDRWLTDGRDTVRLPYDPHSIVPFVMRYTLIVDEEVDVARVLSRQKLPWSTELRHAVFGASYPKLSIEELMLHPSILTSKKDIIHRWMRTEAEVAHPATYPEDQTLMQRALDGDMTPSEAFVCTRGDESGLLMSVCTWLHEIKEAMKRHRVVWISTHLTKNGTLMRDLRGIQKLVREGRVVRSGARVTFSWAAAQLKHSAIPTQYIDDASVPPSSDLAQVRGDLAARVDDFVDARQLCNTMMRLEVENWIAENPFVLKPERTDNVPKRRLREWRRMAQSEGALLVGESVGCVVTLKGGRPVSAVPHPYKSEIVVEGGNSISCVAAQTVLRSIWIDSFADVSRKLTHIQFPRVYVVQELGSEAGWAREMSRWGPVVVLRVCN